MKQDLVLAANENKVRVISPEGTRPGIIRKMVPVEVRSEVVAAEVDRYAGLGEARRTQGTRAAYEALLDGRIMVNLYETLAMGLVVDHSVANTSGALTSFSVAVARPWDRMVYSRCFSSGLGLLYTSAWGNGSPRGQSMFSIGQGERTKRWVTRRATVPSLPPEIRRDFPEALKDRSGKFMILWEPTWQAISTRRPSPPRTWDPALLEQVEGSIYLVRAVWDLTPVETAALLPGPRF
jgi:hypothetical protein